MSAEPEVLLVEDDADDVVIARRAFQQSEIEEKLAVARDGNEALEYLQNPTHELPKVILLDLKMPLVDGFEVLERLRSDERTRDVPVVVVSTSARREDVESCYRLGANSFVVKQYSPFQPGRYLVDVARYWLTLNRLP